MGDSSGRGACRKPGHHNDSKRYRATNTTSSGASAFRPPFKAVFDVLSIRLKMKGTSMNKLVKGSIAAAAGIALLMGGAGSLALWNDSATVSAGTVSTGELNLTSNADGAWATGIALWVPGDSDTYTETFVIEAAGDNIAATISAAYSGATTNGVTSSSTIVVAGETPSSPGVYTLDAGTYTVTVTVNVSFNATGTANQNIVAQPLGNVSVTLQQI